DSPLLQRQALQGHVQPLVDLFLPRGLLGPGFRRDIDVRWRRTCIAQSLESSPVGDAENPSRHPRGAPEIAGVLPDDPERIVDDLLGKLVAGGEPHEKPCEPPVIEEVELLHRGAVAGGDSGGGHIRAPRWSHRLPVLSPSRPMSLNSLPGAPPPQGKWRACACVPPRPRRVTAPRLRSAVG